MIDCKVPGCQCENDPDWWVNAPEYGNCIFQYFQKNPRPHTLSEVANLLGMTISSVTANERKTMAQLKKMIKKELEKLN